MPQNIKPISIVVLLPFLIYLSNNLINKQIEKREIRKVVLENFYKGFDYKLSQENKMAADVLILKLYNNEKVFKKLTEYSKRDSLLMTEYAQFLKTKSKNPEYLNIFEANKRLFLKTSRELYRDRSVRQDMDSLLKIFYTNENFRLDFQNKLIYKKLSNNPFTFFYFKRLLNGLIITKSEQKSHPVRTSSFKSLHSKEIKPVSKNSKPDNKANKFTPRKQIKR